MANTVEECDRMIAAAPPQRPPPLGVNHSARMDPIVPWKAAQRVARAWRDRLRCYRWTSFAARIIRPTPVAPLPPSVPPTAHTRSRNNGGCMGCTCWKTFLGPVRCRGYPLYLGRGATSTCCMTNGRAVVDCEKGQRPHVSVMEPAADAETC